MCTDKIEENCHRSTVWLGSSVGMMLSRYGFEFWPGHALFPSRWHLVALWWLLANIRPFDEVNGREAQQDNYATHHRRGLKMYGSISADAIRPSLSLFSRPMWSLCERKTGFYDCLYISASLNLTRSRILKDTQAIPRIEDSLHPLHPKVFA